MAIDVNTYLRNPSLGNLIASETGTGVKTGVDLHSQVFMLHLPDASGTSPTLTAEIQESDDDANYRTVATFGSGGSNSITAAGTYYVTVKSNAIYHRSKLTVGGTTPNFGAAVVCPVPAGRYTSW